MNAARRKYLAGAADFLVVTDAQRIGAALMTALIATAGLSKAYGEFVALDDVTLSVAEGELVSIVGPTRYQRSEGTPGAVRGRQRDPGRRFFGIDRRPPPRLLVV